MHGCLVKITFGDGAVLDIDTSEFGVGGIGETLDKFADEHGKLIKLEVTREY